MNYIQCEKEVKVAKSPKPERASKFTCIGQYTRYSSDTHCGTTQNVSCNLKLALTPQKTGSKFLTQNASTVAKRSELSAREQASTKAK